MEARQGSSVSMGGDANRAVSQPDSQAPPPDESVGPIPGRSASLATLASTVGPHSVTVGPPHALWAS